MVKTAKTSNWKTAYAVLYVHQCTYLDFDFGVYPGHLQMISETADFSQTRHFIKEGDQNSQNVRLIGQVSGLFFPPL